MGNGSRDSASPKVELGEFYEYGLRLGEVDEQLGESYEDYLVLDELFFKLGELYELLIGFKCQKSNPSCWHVGLAT